MKTTLFLVKVIKKFIYDINDTLEYTIKQTLKSNFTIITRLSCLV